MSRVKQLDAEAWSFSLQSKRITFVSSLTCDVLASVAGLTLASYYFMTGRHVMDGGVGTLVEVEFYTRDRSMMGFNIFNIAAFLIAC